MKSHSTARQASQQPISVSMIQLIANPQSFDGKKIRFIGFIHFAFEGDNFFLHREDFEYSILKNAVWFDRPEHLSGEQMESLNEKYAICEGVFSSENQGHMAANSGAITQITRLQTWFTGESRTSLLEKYREREKL